MRFPKLEDNRCEYQEQRNVHAYTIVTPGSIRDQNINAEVLGQVDNITFNSRNTTGGYVRT